MADALICLKDGFSTKIAFSVSGSGAGTVFEEIEVQPPGLDGGGSIDITTMRNTLWRGKAPRKLITSTDGSITVAYDPTAFGAANGFLNLINVNQLITITFPDGGTYAFWGYCGKFVPDALKEGTRPTAKIDIVATDTNNSGVETAPILTAATGSGW